MAQPGSAYDDPLLGRDPQPGHMRDFVQTGEDNGGVHINSGIPNRAFHLAATALGGHAWEVAGRIWYDTLRLPALTPQADFALFARLSVEQAHGAAQAAVRQAWTDVGVLT
ncbi:metalloprotease [Bordetella pertussis]|nr:metalloprotease [Bordetella pertussis]